MVMLLPVSMIFAFGCLLMWLTQSWGARMVVVVVPMTTACIASLNLALARKQGANSAVLDSFGSQIVAIGWLSALLSFVALAMYMREKLKSGSLPVQIHPSGYTGPEIQDRPTGGYSSGD